LAAAAAAEDSLLGVEGAPHGSGSAGNGAMGARRVSFSSRMSQPGATTAEGQVPSSAAAAARAVALSSAVSAASGRSSSAGVTASGARSPPAHASKSAARERAHRRTRTSSAVLRQHSSHAPSPQQNQQLPQQQQQLPPYSVYGDGNIAGSASAPGVAVAGAAAVPVPRSPPSSDSGSGSGSGGSGSASGANSRFSSRRNSKQPASAGGARNGQSASSTPLRGAALPALIVHGPEAGEGVLQHQPQLAAAAAAAAGASPVPPFLPLLLSPAAAGAGAGPVSPLAVAAAAPPPFAIDPAQVAWMQTQIQYQASLLAAHHAFLAGQAVGAQGGAAHHGPFVPLSPVSALGMPAAYSSAPPSPAAALHPQLHHPGAGVEEYFCSVPQMAPAQAGVVFLPSQAAQGGAVTSTSPEEGQAHVMPVEGLPSTGVALSASSSSASAGCDLPRGNVFLQQGGMVHAPLPTPVDAAASSSSSFTPPSDVSLQFCAGQPSQTHAHTHHHARFVASPPQPQQHQLPLPLPSIQEDREP